MHFDTNPTYPTIQTRLSLLKKLRQTILTYEDKISEALHKDLQKPLFESKITEIYFTLHELNHTIRNLKDWSAPVSVSSSFINPSAKQKIYKQPYGRVLLIAPWNYPFQLALVPLIGAVAAGNNVVLKPSEYAPNTSAIIKEIIEQVFEIRYVTVIEGGALLAKELLKQKWNYIFYTGSTVIGKEIYKAAAENLTPVTLELGGKNPCIVDDTASIKLAAKRIVWGKFLNAGQTCVAPDFVIVHNTIKQAFIEALQQNITAMFGNNIQESNDYGRIINQKHFDRLTTFIDDSVIFGGTTNKGEYYIAPTLLNEPNLNSAVMKDEIFGPILPIISYKNSKELYELLKEYQDSLALYVFTSNKKFAESIITNYSFGGGCINDVVMQLANKELPFGGIGSSGIGKYHGKYTFDTFSHNKSIVTSSKREIPFRYAPYRKKLRLFNWFRKLIYKL